MNNKKGISAIVATVLIILITVAAVTIIWAAIIPMISDSLEGGTACISADRAFEILSGQYTCANATSGVTTVQVRRLAGSDMDLNSFSVSVSEGGTTSSVSAVPAEALTVGPNEEVVYTFAGAVADSATVYATVNTGNGGETKDCAAVIMNIPAC